MLVGCWCVVWSGVRADDTAFSKAVRPEEFSAAGLAKLSPDELARLDALVRDFKGRIVIAAVAPEKPAIANDDLAVRLAAAKHEAAVAEAARVAAEAKAAKAEAEANARVA